MKSITGFHLLLKMCERVYVWHSVSPLSLRQNKSAWGKAFAMGRTGFEPVTSTV